MRTFGLIMIICLLLMPPIRTNAQDLRPRKGLYLSFEIGAQRGIGLLRYADGAQMMNVIPGGAVKLGVGTCFGDLFAVGLGLSVDALSPHSLSEEFFPGDYSTVSLMLVGRYFVHSKPTAPFIMAGFGHAPTSNAGTRGTDGGRRGELGIGKIISFDRVKMVVSLNYHLQEHKNARYRILTGSNGPTNFYTHHQSDSYTHGLAVCVGIFGW